MKYKCMAHERETKRSLLKSGISRLRLSGSGSRRSRGREVLVRGDTEVLLNTSGPEEGDESDDTDEGGSELESIDHTRTVPLSNAHRDEVEEGRKDEPSSAANTEDKVEETLVELSLLTPCSEQAPGEVAPDTNPANKDVNDNESKESTLGINELSRSSTLTGCRDDDEQDQVADKVDNGDDEDSPLARKIVVGDSPAAGDGDKENGKDDVGSTHEELTKDTAAVSTNTIGVVHTPVDHNEEQRENDQDDNTGKDEHDRMSNALAPQEEDGNTVNSTEQQESNKVEDVQSKQTLLIKANLRTILVDEVKSVSDVQLVGGLVATNRAVQKNDVPDVRTDVIVGLELDAHLLPHIVSEVGQTLIYARTALVVVVGTPRAVSIDVKNPAGETRGIGLGGLVDNDRAPALITCRDS